MLLLLEKLNNYHQIESLLQKFHQIESPLQNHKLESLRPLQNHKLESLRLLQKFHQIESLRLPKIPQYQLTKQH